MGAYSASVREQGRGVYRILFPDIHTCIFVVSLMQADFLRHFTFYGSFDKYLGVRKHTWKSEYAYLFLNMISHHLV